MDRTGNYSVNIFYIQYTKKTKLWQQKIEA